MLVLDDVFAMSSFPSLKRMMLSLASGSARELFLKNVLICPEGHSHPGHLQKFDDIIQDQVKQSIISEVPPSQFYTTGTFLSHHAVINESKKTTKMRLVHNGSAKVNGSPSLNDCLFRLFREPVLLPDLSGILLRVRLATILLIGDIEKAFHTVELEDCDRPFTKLLWLKDHRKHPSQENVTTFYFKCIPFELNCSPFLPAATLLDKGA
ncbi:hypothetical protein RB195_025578 [Necator americanus]|uniref:Reverse transcriptase domain-containing protein n=1 Tax=Necator americanus TaxID=51031 RepID=A0ABR1ESY5_NECAM